MNEKTSGVKKQRQGKLLPFLTEIKQKYETGATCEQLAREYGCTATAIQRRLNSLGVAMRRQGSKRKCTLEQVRVTLHENRNKRKKELAAMLGISDATLRAYLRDLRGAGVEI